MTMAARKADFGANHQPYKMSFTSGGLFLNESVIVAELHVVGEDWKVTLSRALEEGATSLPKAASNRRTLREIVNRLMTLTEDEIRFFVEDPGRQEQQAPICGSPHVGLTGSCVSSLLRSFVIGISPISWTCRWRASTSSLMRKPIGMRGWPRSATTRNKLRQILFRMMREAGVISGDNRIQSTYLSAQLGQLIEATNPTDLAVFPGVAIEGGAS